MRRLQVYLDQTAPLIAFYEDHPAAMTRIAADRDVDDIYGEFRSSAVDEHRRWGRVMINLRTRGGDGHDRPCGVDHRSTATRSWPGES